MVHTSHSDNWSRTEPRKDVQTVDSTGYRIGPRIEGLVITPIAPQEDERGELCEIWTADRDPLGLPVAHAYMLTVRTGKTRAWMMHEKQYDRLFIQRGRFRIAMFDARSGSPTQGLLNVFTYSDHQRVLIVIPPGVWHGVQNVGENEAVLVNLSTHAYDYEVPDKLRLPVANDVIPFAFEDGPGW